MFFFYLRLPTAPNSGSGSVTINGGTITADGNGDEVYGIRNSSSKTVKITGGSILGGSYGIYHLGNGTVDISSGTVEGATYGVQVDAGTVSITGGTLQFGR